tara:strand:+ start:359 stop:568 length:210 start_codon:yes stop_codon:yes gene_type:complete
MKPEQIEDISQLISESSEEESVIIAWWERDVWAEMPDDVWEHVCHYMNETYDWSNVTDDISQLITENIK